VKILVLPSSVSDRGSDQHQFLTTYLINDTVAIDAGSLGLCGTPEEQSRVQHVFLTHSHIDHIGSVPLFVENAYAEGRDCVTFHGSDEVLDCLRRDIFNDRVWPDFISMSKTETPFLRLATLTACQPVDIAGLRITPVPVNHVVPTFGFVIEDGKSSVVIVSDTGPTEEIWDHANQAPNLRAVFLEASFPNALGWLAAASKHLTPAMFGTEVRKLQRRALIVAVHIKARYRETIIRELQALDLPDLEVGQFEKAYVF
jgi:ribonuclease BN (tRNA processing enzyme)